MEFIPQRLFVQNTFVHFCIECIFLFIGVLQGQEIFRCNKTGQSLHLILSQVYLIILSFLVCLVVMIFNDPVVKLHTLKISQGAFTSIHTFKSMFIFMCMPMDL